MKGILYTCSFAQLNKAKGIKMSIARYNPVGLDLDIYEVLEADALAPSPTILNEYKEDKLTWFEFGTRFLDELCNEEPENEMFKIIKLLDNGQDITLLYSDTPKEGDHKFILSNIIREKGYKTIEI